MSRNVEQPPTAEALALAEERVALGASGGTERWTDSPFCWLLIFGCAALVGGLAISPKYSQRMDRVERMQAARFKAYVERSGGDASQLHSTASHSISIRELLVFIALLCFGGGAVGRYWERRRRALRPGSLRSDESPSSPSNPA